MTPSATGALHATPTRRAPRRLRWLETVSALLLMGAVGVVALSASPALLRAAGMTRTATITRAPAGFPDRNSIPGADDRSSAGRPGFVFSFDDDEEEEGREESLERDWSSSRAHRHGEPSAARRGDPAAADDDKTPSEVRMGLSRRPLKLLDQPAAGAAATATVQEGELVLIVKQQGDWALVVHSPEMGWVRLSEIAVR